MLQVLTVRSTQLLHEILIIIFLLWCHLRCYEILQTFTLKWIQLSNEFLLIIYFISDVIFNIIMYWKYWLCTWIQLPNGLLIKLFISHRIFSDLLYSQNTGSSNDSTWITGLLKVFVMIIDSEHLMKYRSLSSTQYSIQMLHSQ